MDPVSKAQSGGSKTGGKLRFGQPFKAGAEWRGNRNGRPRKRQVTQIYERILAKRKNRKDIEETVLRILLGGRMAAVLQLREMAERVEGKVAQPVEMSGEVNLTLSERLEKARERKQQ